MLKIGKWTVGHFCGSFRPIVKQKYLTDSLTTLTYQATSVDCQLFVNRLITMSKRIYLKSLWNTFSRLKIRHIYCINKSIFSRKMTQERHLCNMHNFWSGFCAKRQIEKNTKKVVDICFLACYPKGENRQGQRRSPAAGRQFQSKRTFDQTATKTPKILNAAERGGGKIKGFWV